MSSTLNILVLNPLAERHINAINSVVPYINLKFCDFKDAEYYMADTDILVCWGYMKIDKLLANAPRLKWIHALSAGVENLLSPDFISSDVLLTNSKGIHSIPVSEHVLAMTLAFTRGLNIFIRQQTSKLWKRAYTEEIHEKTIGIVGLGSIGREIAKKAKSLGMNVLATKREITSELFVDKLYPANELADMLPYCDFVIAALPLVEETKHLFTLDLFKKMKPSAYFINIARGNIVCEQDLITALEQNIIQGAGLDVFENEPLSQESPLWDMPNVIITPHIAAMSPMYLDRAIKLFTDNLSRFVQHGDMINTVDKNKGY